ncbi:MAG: DUF4235 domain-containing protein [Actinomyces sp.]|uniref:DUF4235 domain-containing protein n=1 Tax=Actinomyces sp. TaxID=29317 RepID=UPI0026DB8F4C|nr:DUF4235 domain-containing protein [Actinomyces sp.]MDO4242876.1 DUF4235 domain-containing protein [Actinomyces sp.]
MPTKNLAWTATSALTMVAAGFVADKIVSTGWKAVTGRATPKDQDELLTAGIAEVVVFAVVSGALISLTRELALRQAATWYDRSALSARFGARGAIKA